MTNVVLDYAVQFNQIESLPEPSTAFLRRLCVPLSRTTAGSTGTIIVGTRDGDTVVPATIEIKGGFKLGDVLALTATRDVEGVLGAEWELDADRDYLTTATDFAAFIAGNTGITVNVVDGGAGLEGATIEILAATPNTTISIDGVEVRRANPLGFQDVTELELTEIVPQYAAQLQGAFDGGLTVITILWVNTVDQIPQYLVGAEADFFTIFNVEFDVAEFMEQTASWEGVRGFVSANDVHEEFIILPNVCGFWHQTNSPVNAYNPLRAFGELLSASLWRNQQYSASSVSDGCVTTVGNAELLFADRWSFWISDNTTGNVLGFFVAGGKSITTPYITAELELLMQADMTNYLAVNQPFNTSISRSQLERIGGKRIQEFIELGYLDPDQANTVQIFESNEVFVVNGNMVVAPAVALWRIRIDAYQTQG